MAPAGTVPGAGPFSLAALTVESGFRNAGFPDVSAPRKITRNTSIRRSFSAGFSATPFVGLRGQRQWHRQPRTDSFPLLLKRVGFVLLGLKPIANPAILFPTMCKLFALRR